MKEWTIKGSNRWGGRKQGITDDSGYFMHSIVLEGHSHQPLDYKAKTFPEVGSKLYGEIVEYTSNKGEERARFETREHKKKENVTQDRIQAQWATRLAVEYTPDHTDKVQVKSLAKLYMEIAEELVEEKY